ncbi:MAG: caspase family protein [Bacteroidia bacterium]|nr:caspase family protein [Bacteroidia bacterium]
MTKKYLPIPLLILSLALLAVGCKPVQTTTTNGDKAVIDFNSASSNGVTITFGEDPKAKNIPVIEWISPIAEKTEGFDHVHIELKVTSEEPLTDANFSVYVAKIKLTDNKAGERPLFKKNNEYFFSANVPLDRGFEMNVVEVRLVTPSGVTVSAPPRFVFIKEKIETELTWISPNIVLYQDKPYTHNDELLPVEFNIQSQGAVTKKDLTIVLNGQRIPATEGATLVQSSNGRYFFKDYIPMANKESFQTVHLEVFGQASEVLKVNFVPLTKPNLYIVAIGPKTDLKYTVNDARDFAALFANQGGSGGNRLYAKVEVLSLLAENATAGEIKGVLEEFRTKYVTQNLKYNDVLAVFISSHGFLNNGNFRIKGDDYKPSRQESTSVSYQDDIIDKLKEIPCKKLIFLDACHSGGATASGEKSDAVSSYEINLAIQKLNKTREGFITIASSQAEQYSYEDDVWKNGAFTESIVKALGSALADTDRNKIITTTELYDYISKEVPRIVKTVKRQDQVPKLVENDLGDIPLFVVTQ